MHLSGSFFFNDDKIKKEKSEESIENYCSFIVSYSREQKVEIKSKTNDKYTLYIAGNVYKYKDEKSNIDELFYVISKFDKLENLKDIFSEVDGYFFAAIIDRVSNETYLVTDRFGMWPLYIFSENNKVKTWSTSLHYINSSCDHSLEVDKNAVQTFLNVSHFLSDNTIFKGIKRVGPATILKLDNNGLQVDEEQYWSWKNVKSLNISFDDAVDRLFDLFIESVRSRLKKDVKYCLTLSGGLDSRALLAAANYIGGYDITCLSFGTPQSQDIEIARNVCDTLGFEHKIVAIDESNWLEGREVGVRNTSGMKSLLHMHVLNSINEITSISDYVINGYVGDLVLGGGYLKKENNRLLTAEEISKSKFAQYSKDIDFDDEYFKHTSSDPIFIYHRGVRFTSMGSDLVNDKVVNIKPFMDNRLLEFVYGLDDNFRCNGKLYHKMLLKYFPEVFSTIPWQSTGKVITGEDSHEFVNSFWMKLRPKLVGFIKKSKWHIKVRDLYVKINNIQTFVDYSNWATNSDFKKYINSTLNSESHVARILGEEEMRFYIDKAIKEKNVEPLGCMLSLEIYFKDIENNE